MESETNAGETATPSDDTGRDEGRVTVERGGIGCVNAREIEVTLGGIGAARADQVTVERGAMGATLANQVHFRQGMMRTVVARDVSVEQSFVRALLASRVDMRQGSFAGLVVAGRVDGEVRTLLDWRGVVAIAAAVAVLRGLFFRHR